MGGGDFEINKGTRDVKKKRKKEESSAMVEAPTESVESFEDAFVEPPESWIGADKYKDRDARAKSQFVASLMNDGAWDTDAERQCADEWGCTRNWVRQLSARASDYLATTTGDRATMSGAVVLRLREVMEQDGPDRVRATELLGKTLGMFRERNTEASPGEQRAHFIACVQAEETSIMDALAEALANASADTRKRIMEMCK